MCLMQSCDKKTCRKHQPRCRNAGHVLGPGSDCSCSHLYLVVVVVVEGPSSGRQNHRDLNTVDLVTCKYAR